MTASCRPAAWLPRRCPCSSEFRKHAYGFSPYGFRTTRERRSRLPARSVAKGKVLAASDARLASVQVEAAAAKELSAQVEKLLERGRFVVEQKRGRPAVAELLDEVTALLPLRYL